MATPIPLSLAVLGCGGRGRTYAQLAARFPERYRLAAAVDPNPIRRGEVEALAPGGRMVTDATAEDFFTRPKCADVLVVATQDAQHREHALAGLKAGYDLLLEKPIAPNRADTQAVVEAARRLGRRVLVCHVLRYTPFYRRVKEILDSGRLGEIVSLNATEGVGAWHQAHSYVRGNWSVAERSSPMILAKSCHDLDILRWLADRPAETVSSEGQLTHFIAANAPAGAPARCTDGCPQGDCCTYNAERYMGDKREWLFAIHPQGVDLPREEIREWLKTSPWGRCVYRCDNTAVDHQAVLLRFAGGMTATFTMTAFESGRHLEIFGTRGRLRGGAFVKATTGADIVVHGLDGVDEERHSVHIAEGGYGEHGGGDYGLMEALHQEMTRPDPGAMAPSIDVSLESHLMAFAAEESRQTGQVVAMEKFLENALPGAS
ncbi:MAG: Gfo/Idh/MocA family oxidoreductase [Verrucomicrobiota bacterium]